MEEMSISDFKATCLKVIERIRATGQSLLITKNGVPAALVSPPPIPQATTRRLFGIAAGRISSSDDIVTPLPPNDWEVLK